MADELEPVTQAFIADMSDYVHPIEEAAADTEVLADAVRQVDEALGTLRDDAAEAGAAMTELAAGEDEAAASSAELDHELHDQTESYFALAAAADAAGVSVDEFAAADRLANLESGGLEATLQGLRDMLGDAGLGESLLVTHTGLNQFRIDTEDVAKATRDARFSEEAFRSSMLDANEASIAARAGMDAYRASLNGLSDAIMRMEVGPNVSKIIDSAIADVAGGGAGGGFLSGIVRLFGDSPGALAANLSALAVGALAIAPAIIAIIQETGLLIAGFSAAALGVGAFAALAIPTFDKVKTAYTNITAAQKAYTAAVQLEAKDPTAINKAAVASALAQLKIAYQNVSPPILTAVRAFQQFKTAYDQVALALQPAVLKIFDQGLHILTGLLPQIKPLAEAAAGAISGLLGKLEKALAPPPVSASRQAIPPGLKSAYDQLVAQQQPTGFQQFMQDIKEISPAAITAIGQGVGQVAGAFGKLITALPKQDVVNAIHIFFQVLTDTLDTIGWIAGRVAHNFTEMKRDIVNWWHDLNQAADHVEGNIAHAYSNIEHALGNIGRAYEAARRDVDHWTKDTIKFVERMYHDVVAFVDRMATDVILWFARMWSDAVKFAERIWHDVSTFAQRMWHDVVTFVDRMATDVILWFARMWSDVTKFAERIWHDVVTFISRMYTDVVNWIKRTVSQVETDWDNGWNKVVTFVKGIPAKIVSALSSLPGRLLQIGIQAIDGLLHGIESAAGGVLNYVRGLASQIAGAFAGVLHILSPSLVFYGHGVNIVQGLINGMESKRGELLATVRSLGTGTTTALTSTASQNIVQHQVTVNLANVMSGPAQQQALQRHVQAAVLSFANTNQGSMLMLPGRRS